MRAPLAPMATRSQPIFMPLVRTLPRLRSYCRSTRSARHGALACVGHRLRPRPPGPLRTRPPLRASRVSDAGLRDHRPHALSVAGLAANLSAERALRRHGAGATSGGLAAGLRVQAGGALIRRGFVSPVAIDGPGVRCGETMGWRGVNSHGGAARWSSNGDHRA